MDEFSAHARGPLRHALRVVDSLGLADTDEESELQEGDNPLVGRMDLEQHAEFSSIHRRCFLPHFPAVKSRFVSYWLYLNEMNLENYSFISPPLEVSSRRVQSVQCIIQIGVLFRYCVIHLV